MIRIQDRLYGEIKLPKIAQELAESCPVLLRLREVRQANIPFFSYPSFANVDRYEHSLGVAHLAWRWAQKNNVPEDLGTALALAALYHDGATPAFGHLFEEFLSRYGFDHEETLTDLICGREMDLPGRENLQVFLGQHCKLRYVLPTPRDVASPLTTIGIADLAGGRGPLGRLIKGDIDFDNIDNVIRAATAMGILNSKDFIHPYEVADALLLEDHEIKLNPQKAYAISVWANIRSLLYSSILSSAMEFRAQTAIKWAIEECSGMDEYLASKSAWNLTEPMLLYEHLRKHAFPRLLVDRVRLGKPPSIIFSALFRDISPLVGRGSRKVIEAICEQVARITNLEVYVNYYVDKRERHVSIPSSRMQTLFLHEDYLNEGSHDAGLSGIVGLVGISRAERRMLTPNQAPSEGLSRHDLNPGKIKEVLGNVLGEEPVLFSKGWVYKKDVGRGDDYRPLF